MQKWLAMDEIADMELTRIANETVQISDLYLGLVSSLPSFSGEEQDEIVTEFLDMITDADAKMAKL